MITIKLDELNKAMIYKNGTYYYNDSISESLKDILYNDIQYNLVDEFSIGYDLSYEIMNAAIDFILENFNDDIDDLTDLMYEHEFASVYTGERLNYITIGNQDIITEKLKEFDCDIQSAAAIWYNEIVREAISRIIDYIEKE